MRRSRPAAGSPTTMFTLTYGASVSLEGLTVRSYSAGYPIDLLLVQIDGPLP